jgi:hypothetical protein
MFVCMAFEVAVQLIQKFPQVEMPDTFQAVEPPNFSVFYLRTTAERIPEQNVRRTICSAADYKTGF